MPHFNINLRTPSVVSESWHIEMPDHTALRIELARYVGEFLKDHANLIWEDEDWRIDVTDESGLILYVMQISATNTAATMPLFKPGH